MVIDLIAASMNANGFDAFADTRSIENFTSAEVIGLPFWNSTPWRR